MVRINLLPHREEKRKLRKTAFAALMVAAVLIGGLIVLAVAGLIASQINNQTQRNDFIKAEVVKLDIQIKEVASLKEEIEALKARQQAVEDLQSDRNQPVHLMDELVKQVPEGIYLKGFQQIGQRVTLNGFAQSNERVSELLRNLGNNSTWLERPELVEIKSSGTNTARDAKRIFDFTVTVGIKRPRDKEQQAKDGQPKDGQSKGAQTIGMVPVPAGSVSTSQAAGSSDSKGTNIKVNLDKDQPADNQQQVAKSNAAPVTSSRSSSKRRR